MSETLLAINLLTQNPSYKVGEFDQPKSIVHPTPLGVAVLTLKELDGKGRILPASIKENINVPFIMNQEQIIPFTENDLREFTQLVIQNMLGEFIDRNDARLLESIKDWLTFLNPQLAK